MGAQLSFAHIFVNEGQLASAKMLECALAALFDTVSLSLAGSQLLVPSIGGEPLSMMGGIRYDEEIAVTIRDNIGGLRAVCFRVNSWGSRAILFTAIGIWWLSLYLHLYLLLPHIETMGLNKGLLVAAATTEKCVFGKSEEILYNLIGEVAAAVRQRLEGGLRAILFAAIGIWWLSLYLHLYLLLPHIETVDKGLAVAAATTGKCVLGNQRRIHTI